MSVGLAVGIIVVAMIGLVVVSMLIEQGGSVIQHIRLRGNATPRNAAAEAAAALHVEAATTPERATAEPATPEPALLVAAVVDDSIEPEPVVTEPVVAELADEPVIESPIPDEPASDEPASDEPVSDEPALVPAAAVAVLATADEPGEQSGAVPEVAAAATPMAPIDGLSWGALTCAKSTVTLRDPQAADTIVGVLLGAYIDGGGTAAKRASAWVTARNTPPSLDPETFGAGTDLRNKTGRVRTLFAATDLDAAWITLRTSVDIERGLKQSPVADPTLDGLLVWWRSTRAVPSVIPATAAARLAAAIASVDDRLEGHPWAVAIGDLHATLVAAAVNDQDVLVGFASADGEPLDGDPVDDRVDDRDDDRDDLAAPESADVGGN